MIEHPEIYQEKDHIGISCKSKHRDNQNSKWKDGNVVISQEKNGEKFIKFLQNSKKSSQTFRINLLDLSLQKDKKDILSVECVS